MELTKMALNSSETDPIMLREAPVEAPTEETAATVVDSVVETLKGNQGTSPVISSKVG